MNSNEYDFENPEDEARYEANINRFYDRLAELCNFDQYPDYEEELKTFLAEELGYAETYKTFDAWALQVNHNVNYFLYILPNGWEFDPQLRAIYDECFAGALELDMKDVDCEIQDTCEMCLRYKRSIGDPVAADTLRTRMRREVGLIGDSDGIISHVYSEKLREIVGAMELLQALAYGLEPKATQSSLDCLENTMEEVKAKRDA